MVIIIKELLINNYINKLTKEHIILFANKNNVTLNDNEVNLIYNYIKKDWKNILYGNSEYIFNDLKNKLDINKYNKIIELFNYYKNIYL